MDALLSSGKAIPDSPAATATGLAAVPSTVLSPSLPRPASSAAPLTKVFLTGRAGGPEEVSVQVVALRISMRSLVESQMNKLFGSPTSPVVVNEFRAWASGVVSSAYPMTLTRILLESLIRKQVPNFGQPDYWLKSVISQAQAANDAGRPVIVTGVEDVPTFKLMQQAGFTHFHVMLSNMTAMNKQLVPNQLSDALDNDVVKKISADRQGSKLRVIWNDTQPCISGRFYSVQDFNKEFATEVIQEGEVSVQ